MLSRLGRSRLAAGRRLLQGSIRNQVKIGRTVSGVSIKSRYGNARTSAESMTPIFGVAAGVYLLTWLNGGDEGNVAECRRVSNGVRKVTDDYEIGEELGRGGFSVVRKARSKHTNQNVAAKFVDLKASSNIDVDSEVELMRKIGLHQNIVCLHEVYDTKKTKILIMDLVEGGELFDFIVDQGSVSEQDASQMLRQVALALYHMHSSGICHNDIKPENVLLESRKPGGAIKVTDFGLSRIQSIGEKVTLKDPDGTWAYWAPEVIRRKPQDHAVDMWAFGTLLYIVLTGVHPFDPHGNRTDAEIVKQIANGTYDVNNRWYKKLSPKAKDLIAHLLDKDPSKRFTAMQVLKHPWMAGAAPQKDLGSEHVERLRAYRRLQQLRSEATAIMLGCGNWKNVNPNQVLKRNLSAASTETVRGAFQVFDKGGNGFIRKEDLQSVFSKLGQELTSEELEHIMACADTNKDEKISFEEFVDMMAGRLSQRGIPSEAELRATFEVFDENGDGWISPEELKHVLHLLGRPRSDKEIQELIQAADLNGDGKIDYMEFASMMTTVLPKTDARASRL